MIRDVVKWHELIAEYRTLRQLEGLTAQSRGQRFNEVIAELLGCWGIEATPSVRGSGEVDVVFANEGVRFILEAKWQKPKADTGQIAKLQKRVRQRIAGTYGIFLSMSGFSDEALADVADGERLEVFLLDASHWDAMLSGLVPPAELLRLVHDRASFHGDAHASLATLLASNAAVPSVDFGPPASMANGPVRTAVDGLTAEAVLSGIDSNQLGIASRADGHLLVTTARKILDVDLENRTVATAVPVPDCLRNPVPLDDGSVVFARRHGVGRFSEGELSVVGGGGTGNISLVRHPDGGIWLFDNGHLAGPGASVTKLGDRAGDEERYSIDWPPGSAISAAWISGTALLSAGNTGILVSDVEHGGNLGRHRLEEGRSMGIAHVGGRILLTAGGATTVRRTDVESGSSEELADLVLAGSVCELAIADNGDVFVAAYQEDRGTEQTFAVVRLRGTGLSE